MNNLNDLYKKVSAKIQEYNAKISKVNGEIAKYSSTIADDTTIRIKKLEEQLVKIDEYLLKARGFQELAKKNLDSQNLLTIEAPPGYRVNLNRLRNWAMMIDPTSSNDPYAQRVYAVAKCDEVFLLQKQEEFRNRIEELKTVHVPGANETVDRLNKELEAYKESLNQYAASSDVTNLTDLVKKENEKYCFDEMPNAFVNAQKHSDIVVPGAYAVPLMFGEEQRAQLKSKLGDFYDAENGHILMPVEIGTETPYIFDIQCAASQRKKLDAAIQYLIFSAVNASPAGSQKVFILDGVRFNTSSIGSLRDLEGSYAMEQIPRNPDQLSATLEQIVSSFADEDEILELQDSVSEYNRTAETGKQIPLKTLILFGWPGAFEGRDRELLQRIMINYERYGYSIITVSYRSAVKDNAATDNPMPEYALQNAVHINMTANDCTLALMDGAPKKFAWYILKKPLLPEYITSFKSFEIQNDTIGNEYMKRYSLTDVEPYTRAYKKLELPFGIDGKDAAHSLSFENENFAAYLVGASRSGKSTLLHTLIAGLIRNYHPDNLELWLADFKQLEFKRYIKHRPPHVKYVLLDESTELVYDLIDKLTAEMMERQKLFSRLGKQRIDQVDTTTLDKPLPVIFVILDEFSIMSQSIAESPAYKLKLQNILAKGAALGIKFLFSSQTFTTGVAGLTATARAQIQQRIAMKGTKDEISETLELSANLKTEQVRNWMDALPPHYALVKFREGADTPPQVKRFLVMYFKDYATRDEMIDRINESMHATTTYAPSELSSYVDKQPVTVDGNTFDAFDEDLIKEQIRLVKEAGKDDLVGDEMYLAFGTPRLMTSVKLATLSAETRENILLIARAQEQACAASVMLSAIKSYRLQGGAVEIWTYGKNQLYRAYRDEFEALQVKIVEDLDDICVSISDLKVAMLKRESFNKLIVLIGIDRICMDFDYTSGGVSKADEKTASIDEERKQFVKNGATVQTESDALNQKFAMAWMKKKSSLTNEAKAAGKSAEEIKAMLSEEMKKFQAEFYAKNAQSQAKNQPAPARNADSQERQLQQAMPETPVSESDSTAVKTTAYNASEDFTYVVKQGSRLGCHFMVTLNNVSDIKQCGLKTDFFRYAMSFQLSVDDSRTLYNNKIATELPEHICQYSDKLETYSFRPYLHQGVGWEGWFVDESGNVISPYSETEDD